MQQWEIDNVLVVADDQISRDEAAKYVQEEQARLRVRGGQLSRVELRSCDNDEVEIKSIAKSAITRVRRITGYLSTLDRFNDAKQAETRDRINHL